MVDKYAVMDTEYQRINGFLVNIFNEILKTEEESLKKDPSHNLSIREMHTIETVCKAVESGENTASEIAAFQRITGGTLTTTVNRLEKKGYVLRMQDQKDKRQVRILPTEKGRLANMVHASFHKKMVQSVMAVLNEEELAAFVKGLETIEAFFRSKGAGGKAKKEGAGQE